MLKKRVRNLFVLLLVIMAVSLHANSSAAGDSDLPTAEEFLAALNFQQGEIDLPGNIAGIKASDDFLYLSPDDTEKLLVDGWGNPPGNETLGMLVPRAANPLGPNGWGIVISYEEDGHVADDDAESINYDDMLKTMKEVTSVESEQRIKAGYEAMKLVGWAEKPHYDKSSHKLYWAKEIKFGDDPSNTLNYDIRILGRKGVLILSAVAGMSQLEEIKEPMQTVLAITDFKAGNSYADFNPGVDKLAAYGIGALIAGKMAAKVGLFAKLGALLLAFKKGLIAVAIAIGAFIRKFLKGKKEKQEITA